ncbi:hypothetical protein BC938DRAFT_477151 [Jimgerdemannia flammicorona]|uniref:Uncharacterized protein n=1 Tax=Jimgerdemannia flammicorona TaxID=994334 RepID=A0A433QPS1_9FUNG|nr:hypothetical protein BC938DRAFT_477151 [Jimgerdemannia flammicorona]
MAKLKVCDWSSLDDNMVRNRALTTRFLIKQVIATGMEEVEPTIEPLKSGAIIEDKPATFLDVFVRSFFESNAQERSTALEDAEWYELYTTFVEFIVDRRIGRARQWFSVNTARFPSDHTEIAAASYELEQESEKLHNLAHETSEAIQIPLCKLLAGHDGFHHMHEANWT